MEKTDASENPPKGEKSLRDQHIVENIFERALWNVRYIVLLGVIFGALSAIVLFIAGSSEIYHYSGGIFSDRATYPHP